MEGDVYRVCGRLWARLCSLENKTNCIIYEKERQIQELTEKLRRREAQIRFLDSLYAGIYSNGG